MLTDYPYSLLKENERNYAVMLLRDQQGCTFKVLADHLHITPSRAKELYSRIKVKQCRLYIRHISVVLRCENTSQMQRVYSEAFDWYRDIACVAAYFEKTFGEILTPYRQGEPGVPAAFLDALPPFQAKLSQQTIDRVVSLRERQRASFKRIAEELHLTPAKARHIYDWYYHQKVMILVEEVEAQTGRTGIWKDYADRFRTSRERYEAMKKELL